MEKFRDAHWLEAEALRQGCQNWAEEFRNRPVRVCPQFPEALDGRQQDICEPLLAIADSLGGYWPHNVRNALTKLLASRERHVSTPENELLRAVQRYVREQKVAEFYSQDFCNWANALEETPWSVLPMKPTTLASMLQVYEIYPRQINRLVNGQQVNRRGYAVAQFKQAFNRYLEPETNGM